jgi:acyl dehydratase
MMDEIFKIEDVTIGINRGFDKIRFISPLLSGDRVRLLVELLEVSQGPRYVDTKLRLIFEGEGYSKPVCVAELLKRFLLSISGTNDLLSGSGLNEAT